MGRRGTSRTAATARGLGFEAAQNVFRGDDMGVGGIDCFLETFRGGRNERHMAQSRCLLCHEKRAVRVGVVRDISPFPFCIECESKYRQLREWVKEDYG